MSEQSNLSVRDMLVDVSSSYGKLRCFQHLLPLVVKTNPHTYISVGDPGDPLDVTWLELALTGMENLRRRSLHPVASAAIIGTGGGLDAIGISNIFRPESIVASDIHPRALEAARWNIGRYVRRGTRCDVLRSDLFRQYPAESRFDLIYENLPNVPEGTDLLEGIRSASCFSPASYQSDPEADRLLLTLHYNCLLEARAHLHDDGWIVAMIGGRVAWEAIKAMFARAGYRACVLHFALKTQTEPEVVLEGYARAEHDGSRSFLYYHPPDACREILAGSGSRNSAMPGTAGGARPGPDGAGGPSIQQEEREEREEEREEGGNGRARSTGEGAADGLFADAWIRARNAELERCRVCAGEALRLHRRGEKVCHSVYVVGGTPLSAPESEG